MTKPLVLVSIPLLLLAGCAGGRTNRLDEELASYRYEQEKYRRKDLEALYAEEARRSEELTQAILLLRKEIAAREAELEALRSRLSDLEAEAAGAREKVRAAEGSAAGAAGTSPESPR